MWGYALLLNGIFLVFAVYRFGAEKLRTEAVNEVRVTMCDVLGVMMWFVVWDWRLETSTIMGVCDLVSQVIITTCTPPSLLLLL